MLRYCCILLCLLITSTSAIAQKSPGNKGEPLVINNDTLFTYYTGLGTLSAKERVLVVHKRLREIVSRLDFNPDSLLLKNDTAISVISYKAELVMSVTDKDASFSELNRPQLAASCLAKLKKELGDIFANNTIKQTTKNIFTALAVFAGLILIIWGVHRIFKRIKARLILLWEDRVAKLSEKLKPVSYANRLLPLFIKLLGFGRLIIDILLIYLALSVVFLIFPGTKPFSTELLSYVINPAKGILLAVIRYVPNLLTIAVIYLVTHYLVKLIKIVATELANGSFSIEGFYDEWAMPTFNIVRVLLYAFMFVVIFPYLPGSQSDVFKGVTVFLGVLVSLGSSSAIANAVAGIVITYMRPFKMGDIVKVGDIRGYVIEKNLLITRIRTIKNEDITVPNATILSGITINYTSSAKTLGLIVHTSITIGYDAPWRDIHELLISAALATENILPDPKPFVLQTELNDFTITYQINAYINQTQGLAQIYSGLHQNIQDKFNEAGVEIMSPHFTSLRDGNAIQIPDDYKPEGYKKGGFKVEKEK